MLTCPTCHCGYPRRAAPSSTLGSPASVFPQTSFLPGLQTMKVLGCTIPTAPTFGIAWTVSLLLKCAMTILRGTGRCILVLSVLILIVPAVTGQNSKAGVKVSYESSGSSRVARFTNSNPYPVRVEFSYQGTRARGSGEASGEDAVFVAATFSATYARPGISITSVRIKGVMKSD
jgi:hypothetical protein